MTEQPEYLTTREVAELLRMRERRVYDLAAAGEIPCRRVTGRLLFPRAEIDAWIGAPAPAAQRPAHPDMVVAGSHDPLLDWALRASGCALPSFLDGSLDGMERLAAGTAAVVGGQGLRRTGTGTNRRRRPASLVCWRLRLMCAAIFRAKAVPRHN
jgi:DNA binding domain, excisionase family